MYVRSKCSERQRSLDQLINILVTRTVKSVNYNVCLPQVARIRREAHGLRHCPLDRSLMINYTSDETSTSTLISLLQFSFERTEPVDQSTNKLHFTVVGWFRLDVHVLVLHSYEYLEVNQ